VILLAMLILQDPPSIAPPTPGDKSEAIAVQPAERDLR